MLRWQIPWPGSPPPGSALSSSARQIGTWSGGIRAQGSGNGFSWEVPLRLEEGGTRLGKIWENESHHSGQRGGTEVPLSVVRGSNLGESGADLG